MNSELKAKPSKRGFGPCERRTLQALPPSARVFVFPKSETRGKNVSARVVEAKVCEADVVELAAHGRRL